MNFKEIEQFLLKNQKIVSGIVVGVIVIIVVAIGYFNYYMPKKNQEAQEMLFQAQLYFQQDSFQQVVNGDGINSGAPKVADEFARTATGNLARYITGVSYLYMNDFDQAIDFLKDYKEQDEVIGAMSHMALGDAYMEKGRTDNSFYEKGLAEYKKAAEMTTNSFVAPKVLFKIARAYEYFDKKDKAVDYYKQILEEYPLSAEKSEAEKYAAKLEAQAV